jgi:hypothetical protein
MTKTKRISGMIALTVFIGAFIYMLYAGYQLRRNFKFTEGTITYITPPGWKHSGDYSIVFEYQVQGKVYNGNNNYNYCHGQSMAGMRSLLVGKQFPVVYAVKDPSTGFMLLTQQYANKYKYQLPDSVRFYDSVLTCK